jgi:hypothetical protein
MPPVDPIEVEILEPRAVPSPSDREIRALVRVEELRLERTKVRMIGVIVVASIAGFVGTCHAICGVAS